MTPAELFSHYARCRKVLTKLQWVILLFLATDPDRASNYQETMAALSWSSNSRGSYTYWKNAVQPLSEAGLLTFTPGRRGRNASTAQITAKGYRFLGFKPTPTPP